MAKKKLKDCPVYTENPFIGPMIKHVKEQYKTISISKTNGQQAMIASNGDSYESTMLTHIKKKVDSEEFVKIYKGQLSSLFELSKPAQNILQYVLKTLKPNIDYVILSPTDAMEKLRYKNKKSYYDGLEEIVAKEILGRSNVVNKYFINPAIIFNGSRLRIIQDYQLQPGLDANNQRHNDNKESEDW